MDAVNNNLPPRDGPNTNQSADVDPVLTAVNQFPPAAKTVDTQFVLKSTEADESFGESDMKEEPCDGTKAVGKRNAVGEEYLTEKELHEHTHVNCREKYKAMRGAWAWVHVLSSIGIDIESPDDLKNPNCELRLRKPYSEDEVSDDDEDELTYNDLREYYEKREREVLPREMWDSNWRKSKRTDVIS